ncbi:MAG TPA: class I SAM-dependent methyltransferase [Thermodesulfovibrionia bacterium]|nr:class I SAM-dependent methyltransferase [Thermodesulfovibrionia bacterium]
MTKDNVTFSFGKNWGNFIGQHFNQERVNVALKHLLVFLELENLNNRYFLDIGCGSGIHSLAALKANAARIVSVDIDPYSVETTKKIMKMNGSPSCWEILSGSILDKEFIVKLEPADIVYSWGVLHHTGNLWQAVRNAAYLIKEGGLFYIAIYESTSRSNHWIKVKKRYNRSSAVVKRLMELGYVWNAFFKTLSPIKIKASMQYIRNYNRSRGMEFWTDVKDWLGGWPYEPATQQEVCRFCEDVLKLERIKVKAGEANIEYLFKKRMNI